MRPENEVHFLGEFHHSKEGFFDGAIEKKGLGLFGGKNKKNYKKQMSDATWRIKDVLNAIIKINVIAE